MTEEAKSLGNSPIYPACKSHAEWRLGSDTRTVLDRMQREPPPAANMHQEMQEIRGQEAFSSFGHLLLLLSVALQLQAGQGKGNEFPSVQKSLINKVIFPH